MINIILNYIGDYFKPRSWKIQTLFPLVFHDVCYLVMRSISLGGTGAPCSAQSDESFILLRVMEHVSDYSFMY